MLTTPSSPALKVLFGQPKTRIVDDEEGRITVHLATPHLGGIAEEAIFAPHGIVEAPASGTRLITAGDWMAGAIVWPVRALLDEMALSVYREVLALTRGWTPARIWNYVPDINDESTGLENYRRFNLGRWQAYHDAFGDHFPTWLPAASAVGTSNGALVTIFLATKHHVHPFENPEQIPAWRYPVVHGPKAPSFARACRVEEPNAAVQPAWISGTASIKGHESLGLGDLPHQLDVTLDNLNIMAQQLGTPTLAEALQHPDSALKVYLRRPEDTAATETFLKKHHLLIPNTTLIQADICRTELDVEIEAYFMQPV
jgi:chorismate lyase / 3-hydroxybenzoate synthase